MNQTKTYTYDHHPIYFDFQQTVERFFVEEIPLYPLSGFGNYLILKLKKTDMSTWKLIHVISQATGLTERDIGYAGLKDKNATAIQYISIPKQYEADLTTNLTTERVEILQKSYHKTPIKIGHLKANRFSIVLEKVDAKDAKSFDSVAKMMEKNGIPNYFGYQRFGEDNHSYQQGKEIAHSGKKLKGAKEKLLVSAYQSHLFNSWLHSRIEISKTIVTHSPHIAVKELGYPLALVKALKEQPQFLKLFIGDLLQTYPNGKITPLTDMQTASLSFQEGKLSPTGLLCGANIQRSLSDAYHLEIPFDDTELSSLKGDRRYAWIWPQEVSTTYTSATHKLIVNFTLPKGAYATTFLEEIGKMTLKR